MKFIRVLLLVYFALSAVNLMAMKSMPDIDDGHDVPSDQAKSFTIICMGDERIEDVSATALVYSDFLGSAISFKRAQKNTSEIHVGAYSISLMQHIVNCMARIAIAKKEDTTDFDIILHLSIYIESFLTPENIAEFEHAVDFLSIRFLQKALALFYARHIDKYCKPEDLYYKKDDDSYIGTDDGLIRQAYQIWHNTPIRYGEKTTARALIDWGLLPEEASGLDDDPDEFIASMIDRNSYQQLQGIVDVVNKHCLPLSKTIHTSLVKIFVERMSMVEPFETKAFFNDVLKASSSTGVDPTRYPTAVMALRLVIARKFQFDPIEDGFPCDIFRSDMHDAIESLPSSYEESLPFFGVQHFLTQKMIKNGEGLVYLSFGNSWKSIPDSIGNLRHLISLVLSKLALTSIPSSIGNLVFLESLYLYDNQLTEIPHSLGHLDRLFILQLYNNQLVRLPDSIGRLTRLEILGLTNNQLTSIPDSISRLTRLRTLDLSNNQLVSLPEPISHSTSLMWMTLAYALSCIIQ